MKVQITNGMYMALIINMVYAKAIGITQGSMARDVGSDMWISTVIANLIAITLLLLVVYIVKKMPQGDLIDQSKIMLGNWFSKILSLIILAFFMFAFAPIMVTFVFHLNDFFLPEAPVILFVVIAIGVGTFAAFFGVEVIGRMALIGVFSILLLNALIIIGSIGEFDIRELLPIFENGVREPILASRHHLADWTLVIMMATMLLPTVKSPKEWRNSSIAGVLFTGLIIVLWPILEIGVLSSQVTSHYIVSCMQLARSAHVGYFLHRYEMIMIALFGISLMCQIMISLLCGSIAASKLVGLKDYRKLLIPVGILFGIYSYWVVSDHNRAMKILENEWVTQSLTITLSVLGSIFILGFLFKKKLKKESEQAK
ncbi:GerAB/ArcD/ProY family transporter [Bacillaceae bacterium S4-13-58]